MTQFTQTSTLETNRRRIPRPRKGNFNYYAAKEGVLKVKGYNFGEKDVVLDRELEGFSTVNPFGITDKTTVIEAFNALTAGGLSADLYQGTLDASGGIDYPAATIDQYWRISADGTIGTQVVEAGDMVICITDYAGGADDTKFMIVEKNISDISDLTDTEQLLDKTLSVTYAELVALRDASELIVGQNYLITDFAQSYNIFDGGTMDIIEEQIGTVEPIIVTASKVNELHKVAISTVYPQDIIHYSLDILDIRDIGYGNGVDTVNANFKGMIYYRKDTVQNVETHYDFRNIKFRRWAVDAELYEDGAYATYTGQVSGMTTDVTLTADTIGVVGNTISLLGDGIKTIATLVSDWNTANPANTVTVTVGDDTQIPDTGFYLTLDDGVDPIAYVAKDVCKSGVDGKIYKCITATTGEGDPTVNTTDWVLWLDITADAFVSWTSDKTKFNIGGITTTNLIINNVTAGVDYDDFATFGDYYKWVKNVSIGMIDLEYAIQGYSYATQLNDIVCKTIDDFRTCFGNNIGSNCWNNTIGYVFAYNTIGNDFINNTIGNNFNTNTIGYVFASNTIGNRFNSNTIGNDFYTNTIGNRFNSNTIGNDFYSNTIGNSFNSNAIGDKFSFNAIGDGFGNNTIGDGFNSNAIGNEFRSNTIGNYFNNNAIGYYFNNNAIGYYLYKTIFGDNCQYNTIANRINEAGTDKIITFGDSITMCTIQDFAFGVLAADLDLTAATHIRGAYNTTIYQDKTDGVKLSYMDGGVMQIVDVTA